MAFHHAPITKSLLMGWALTSISVAIFDLKHYFPLQFDPHVSKYHQYWRLLSHHFACTNSSDLFLTEVLLYNIGVNVERCFGSAKFASHLAISTLVSMILEFSTLLFLHKVGLNYLPAAPIALLFNVLYQHTRLVPAAYQFSLCGIPLTDRIYIYILAAQLAWGDLPGSAAAACIGVVTGMLYRSDMIGLKSYRLPPWVLSLGSSLVLPLVGTTRAPRRSNRALPDRDQSRSLFDANPREGNTEVVTTAVTPASTGATTDGSGTGAASGAGRPSVVRQWVNELTGRLDVAPLRTPTDAEITQVALMFPDVRREDLVQALQRSRTVEAAVESLLSS